MGQISITYVYIKNLSPLLTGHEVEGSSSTISGSFLKFLLHFATPTN